METTADDMPGERDETLPSSPMTDAQAAEAQREGDTDAEEGDMPGEGSEEQIADEASDTDESLS